jgi:hypothetical protein
MEPSIRTGRLIAPSGTAALRGSYLSQPLTCFERTIAVPKRLLAASVLLSALLIASAVVSHSAPAAKSAPGTLVIVFKDGHRQAFSLSDIERVEFPGGSSTAATTTANPHAPPRGRYIGKWEVGDGVGNTFTITLNDNGSAHRSLADVHGRWVYSNGEALITWDDGAQDAIRKVGNHYQKSAYGAGKLFTDQPDNVTNAHYTRLTSD